VTKRICLGLQRRDRELALHGHETGRVVQMPNGAFMEVHKPLTDHERWILVAHEAHRPLELEPATDRNGVDRPGYRADSFRHKLSRFFYEDRIEPVTPAELAAAGHHGELEETDHHAEGLRGGSVALDHFPSTTHGSGDVESAAGGSVATLARSEKR
jgi:ubiquinol-cytochrome c reductase cytochrome b subunit